MQSTLNATYLTRFSSPSNGYAWIQIGDQEDLGEPDNNKDKFIPGPIVKPSSTSTIHRELSFFFYVSLPSSSSLTPISTRSYARPQFLVEMGARRMLQQTMDGVF